MPDESILNGTKKLLGIDQADTAFDMDILMHINTAFFTLDQIGIGPDDGYQIEGPDEKWSDFLGTTKKFNSVKSYVFMKVKVLFDPPAVWHAMNAMNSMITELEWRLSVQAANIKNALMADSSAFVWHIDSTQQFPIEAYSGDVGIDPETGDVYRVVDTNPDQHFEEARIMLSTELNNDEVQMIGDDF